MAEFIRNAGVTLILLILIKAGGRKLDAYMIGIYGGSYCLSSFIQWVIPAVNNSVIVKFFDKVSSMI